MGAPSDEKGKKKQNADLSRLWKATPTRIPDGDKSSSEAVLQPAIPLEPIKWKFLAGFAAVIFVVVFVVYAYSLYGVPVFNDDLNLQTFQRSYNTSVFWAQQIGNVLSMPLSQSWVKLTYGLDAISFPKMPAWYHLVNVMLHALSCVYFYFFVLQICLRLKAEKRSQHNPYVFALCASLLFACHPLATGAAAYISGRAALLASCNYFLCLNLFLLAFYAQSVLRIVSLYLLSLLFFFVGISCSLQALTLPLVALLLASVMKPIDISWSLWLKERYQDFGTIALFGVTVIIALLTSRSILLDNGVDLMQMTHGAYAASCCKSFVTYFLRCFLVPAGLSIEPPFTVAQSFADPVSIVGLVLLLCGASSYFWLKRQPLLNIALAIATLPFLTDLCFVQHEFVSDQKFYFALAGLSLVVCSLVFELTRETRKAQPKQMVAAGVLLLVVLSGLSVWREDAWLKSIGIWTGKQENISPRALAEFGRVRFQANAIDEAVKIENEALQKDPDCPNAHEVLGQIYFARNQFEKAVKEFELALESCGPRNTASEKKFVYQEQLIDACVQMHDFVKAQKNITPALLAYPGNSNVHRLAGQILLGEQQAITALQELRTAYSQDPNNVTLIEPMTEALLDVGGPQYVRMAYALAQKAMTPFASAKLRLLYARAALDLGRPQAAVPKLQLALKMEPENAEGLYLMSVAYHQFGDEKSAASWKQRALARDADIEKKAVLHMEPQKPAAVTTQNSAESKTP